MMTNNLFAAAYAALERSRAAYLADLAAQEQTVPPVYTYQGTAPSGFVRVSKDGSPPYEIGRQITSGSIRIGEPVAVLGSNGIYRVIGRPHSGPVMAERTVPDFFSVFWVFGRETPEELFSSRALIQLIFVFNSRRLEISFRGERGGYFLSSVVRGTTAQFELLECFSESEFQFRQIIFDGRRLFSQVSSSPVGQMEGEPFYSFPPRYPYLEPFSVEFAETSPPLELYDWSPLPIPPAGTFTGRTVVGIEVRGERPARPSEYRLLFYGIYRERAM